MRQIRVGLLRYGLGALLVFFFSFSTHAQELNATVEIDRSRIDDASLNYLTNLPSQLEDYLNEYTWTNDNFQSEEQINLILQINLLSVTPDFTFSANVIVRSLRPIYGSTRSTTAFLFNDENWTFNYTPNRALVHDELQFDGIASLLDFYAYVILGFDYDTFSPLGGTPYFSEAQNIVSLAQTTTAAGWERSNRIPRSRPRLLADLLNPNYEPMRRALYVYHREGLDQFLDDPPAARQQIIRALELMQQARRQTTNVLLFDTFFNAKYQELVSIFEDAPPSVRQSVLDILSEIDPNHLTTYRQLQ